MKRKYLYLGLPVIGTLLVLWYIKIATYDILISDYIRMINYYLPDVWNPDKFLLPDILTRIPINYLTRGINVTFFNYSSTYDMILGALGLGASAMVLGIYSCKRGLGACWYLMLTVVLFSLNKWEMLTNGTGWIHFLAFAFFYYHYLVLDRVESGEEKKGDQWRLCLLPFLITLGIAGPYCAIYSAVLMLAYAFCFFRSLMKKRKWDIRYVVYGTCVLIPLLLYMWSNSYVVEDHAGAVEGPFLPALISNPVFFIKFFVKSFSSMMLGKEQAERLIEQGFMANHMLYLMAVLVIAAYLLALWLNIKYRLHKKTILPLILILSGGMNHLLITISRWIFMRLDYGMSSRYALQFQIGILGIILTVGLLWKKIGSRLVRGFFILFFVGLLLGNGYTSLEEIKKAPFREEWGKQAAEMALHYEDAEDEELVRQFQYRSARHIRMALRVLEENQLSIFGR